MAKNVKTAVYDLNGTLVPSVTAEALAHYERKLRDILEPLRRLDDDEIRKALEEKGVNLEGKNLNEKIADFVLEAVRKPKRGTKAREVYYDLLELAYDRGEIQSKALPDALAEGNAIDLDKNEGFTVVALSRGPDSLLFKALKLSGLEGRVKKIYSTLPFGGEKKAKAYAGICEKLKSEGLEPKRFYEDEFANIQELFKFGLSLAQREYPFEIIWVNRKKENWGADIGNMRKAFRKKFLEKDFSKVFREVENLL